MKICSSSLKAAVAMTWGQTAPLHSEAGSTSTSSVVSGVLL